MSERDPPDTPRPAADEPFLGRWSRLKAEARQREAHAPPAAPDAQAHEVPPEAATGATPAGGDAPPVQLPDVEQLGEDSDYSAFLTPGVDAGLRQRALRKLFHSPKFNVFDGLDTYRDDFTSFPALGSIVTVDMRHQLERAARELAARAEKSLSGEAPATDASPAAITQQPAPAPAGESTERNDDDAEHGTA
jgi:hypothetical protein